MDTILSLFIFCAFLGIPNTIAGNVASDGGKIADPGDSGGFKFGVTNPSEPRQEEYRTYFTGQQQQPQFPNHGEWNREASYTPPAATDLGYSGDASQGYHTHTSYHPAPSTSYGTDEGYDLDGGAGGILGGLGGLGGLLGIKGLKGLGVLGLLKLGIIPLLFLIIPAIILLPLLLLFLPIPVITIPQGRRFGVDVNDISDKVSSFARSVLDSDKCIERISCEVSRYGRGTFLDQTLKRMIYKYETQMPNPLQRMARAYMEAPLPGCKKYNCFLLDDVNRTSSNRSKKFKKTS